MPKTYFTPEDAQELVEEVRKMVPGIAAMPIKHATELVSTAFRETTVTVKSIEERIAEAGCMPADIAAIFLHYGAVAAVIEDLPLTDERRKVVAAGRAMGKAIAASFGKKIQGELEERSHKERC